jgi:hypothetical protein
MTELEFAPREVVEPDSERTKPSSKRGGQRPSYPGCHDQMLSMFEQRDEQQSSVNDRMFEQFREIREELVANRQETRDNRKEIGEIRSILLKSIKVRLQDDKTPHGTSDPPPPHAETMDVTVGTVKVRSSPRAFIPVALAVVVSVAMASGAYVLGSWGRPTQHSTPTK